MLGREDLAGREDVHLGDLRISPGRLLVDGPSGRGHIEPQVMHVFLRLLEADGQVVTRDRLFRDCWGGGAVGDDSLNRAIAGVRQIATLVGSSAFELQTVPRVGYALRILSDVRRPGEDDAVLKRAVERAMDCWRAGLPTEDADVSAALEEALSEKPNASQAWGVLALLLRKAVEYAPPERSAELIRRCEEAGRQALALDARQSDARVALTGVMPLLGHWLAPRRQLLDVLATDADHAPARHDLAVLEMATGRPSAARPLIERLIADDPLAATYHYKRIYHLWTFGELDEMEKVAIRALQLWPRHPAIGMARFWTLLFTGRAEQARQMTLDERVRLPMPPPLAQLLRRVCDARDMSMGSEDRQLLVDEVAALAHRGPVFAVAALMALMALEAAPRALDVAYSYYLGRGTAATPLWLGADEAAVTDQARRITQPLFLPCAGDLRALPRFADLCLDLGLADYWAKAGLVPDHLA